MSLLRWTWSVLVLALVATGCATQPQTPGPDGCVSVKDGVSYSYVWDNSEVSLTISPINESGVRCDDVTVSLVGWEPTNYPARWPQRVVEAKTITLAKDSDVPLKATIPAKCQNDAYWGEAPAIGHINTTGGVPWVETFVNHQLPNGTGTNFAADPMTGGLTANVGPCGPGGTTPTQEPTQDPTQEPTQDPTQEPTTCAPTPSATATTSPKPSPSSEERLSGEESGETEDSGNDPCETGGPTPTNEPTTCAPSPQITEFASPSASPTPQERMPAGSNGSAGMSEPEDSAEPCPTETTEPTQEPTGDPNEDPEPGEMAQSVDAGVEHTCMIKDDGTLWCWGRNNYWQTGTSTLPYDVVNLTQVGTSNDWQSVSAGG
ncbi:MAG TPA: hypothetical protein PKM12_08935, partial [Marmoricola sp.]|nr:hypothetical protein [Marmoricola sp.]